MQFDLDFLNDEGLGTPSYYRDLQKEVQGFETEKASDLRLDSSNFTFQIPNVSNEKSFFKNLSNDKDTKKISELKKGTTTLAFKYKHGIIVAVDSRASMGSFMSSGNVKKIIEINDYLLGTMAGGAADCSFWERRLAWWCKLYELRNGERISVTAAANFLCNMVSQYKGRGLSMGTMVTGSDLSGFHLFYVDNDGMCLEGNMFSCGSGSTFAYGVLDTKYRWDMNEEQACQLGYEAICNATYRDAGSGGKVRVYSVVPGGWKVLVSGDDVDQSHWKYSKNRGLAGDGDETGGDKLEI